MADWVYRTAAFSAMAQIVLGLLSLAGFAKTPQDEATQLLWVLLILDIAVQFIEFLFYVYFIYKL